MEHQQPQTPPTTTHPVGSHPPPGTSKSTQQMPSPTPRQRMHRYRHRMRPHQTRRQPQPRQPAMALTRMPQSQNRPGNTRTQPPTKNHQTTPKRTPSRPTQLTKTPWGSTLRIARYNRRIAPRRIRTARWYGFGLFLIFDPLAVNVRLWARFSRFWACFGWFVGVLSGYFYRCHDIRYQCHDIHIIVDIAVFALVFLPMSRYN